MTHTINKQALRKLIEAWEAGDWVPDLARAVFGNTKDPYYIAYRTMNGSLDAAEAMHDALVPEWVLYRMHWWKSASPPAVVEIWGTTDGSHSFKDGRADANGQTPARAWGLAILKAVEAQL